ncbi:uncharacterized protein LOC111017071 [Momordica charantia]|uniref:Uncharacterized protein LOC111017071 n=1 Tax=Momordica charantia TaxID=3673 RepID=A0A6J1D5B7_MOMCH|nr:uncharacterized protein LOC111017071 [Momordica charantia]
MNANQSAVIDFLRASMEKEHKAKSRIPKPPTRLQKQAPASLHLDQVSSTSMAPGGAETSSKAILPLLSPLPLSPQPWPETEENNTNRVSAANENAVDGGGDQRGEMSRWANFTEQIEGTAIGNGRDILWWKADPSGRFTVNSAFMALTSPSSKLNSATENLIRNFRVPKILHLDFIL